MRTRHTLIVGYILAAACIFNSCKKESNSPNDLIVGTWKSEGSNGNDDDLIFNSDGSGSELRPPYTYTFTYEVKGSDSLYVYNIVSNAPISAQTPSLLHGRNHIDELSSSKLVITNTKPSQYSFSK